MSLQAVYEKFLGSPDSHLLSDNASFNYITTLTTFNTAEAIVNHLDTQNKNVVKKKAEKVIGAVEGQSAVSLDVETTLEFISGGGAYLPGLENFVTDKIATFPVIHTVHFDQDNKIQHIRIFWDQGALLRQVDIIGSRGKNWPICDSKDQARLVASGPSALASNKAPAVMSRGREMNEVPAASRSESPSKKHMKDPHSSLELFGPEKVDAGSGRSQPNAIAPRVSAKPPQREMSELFAAGHEDYEPGRPRSPLKKENQPVIIPPKGAGGQKFQPSRLFSEDPDTDSPALYKSNPAKYDHFDIGDAPQQDHFQHARAPLSENAIPLRARTNKHVSQWGFEDFVTPEKVRPKTRSQDQRHFGWSDDEGENAETPGKHPKVAAPRPSSEVHFEMKDDGVLSAKKRPTGPAKGSLSNKSLGLYQNNLYEDGMHTGVAESGTRPLKGTSNHVGMYENNVSGDKDQENQPLKNVTNNIGRSNDFNSNGFVADSATVSNGKTNKENKPLGADHKKAVDMMAAQWDTYDESPEPAKKPTNARGLRKGQESHWGPEFENENSKPMGDRKEAKNFWDF